MIIEKAIREYLLAEIPQASVYAEVPPSPDATRIEIERTGGGEEEHIRSAMVAIKSIAPTLYGAAVLHEAVLATMPLMAASDDISSVKLNSEYNFTDTTTKEYRYQAVFDIIYY